MHITHNHILPSYAMAAHNNKKASCLSLTLSRGGRRVIQVAFPSNIPNDTLTSMASSATFRACPARTRTHTLMKRISCSPGAVHSHGVLGSLGPCSAPVSRRAWSDRKQGERKPELQLSFPNTDEHASACTTVTQAGKSRTSVSVFTQASAPKRSRVWAVRQPRFLHQL